MPDNAEVQEVLDNSNESVTVLKQEESEEGVKETSNKPSEPSESEVRAMAGGWRPKEEYEGDPKKWVDADEFLRRGELFEKIDIMGKELRDTKKAMKMLQHHHEQVREAEFKKAQAELRAEKKRAYEEGDHDKIVEIDDQMLDLRDSQRAERAAIEQQASKPDPRFVSWIQKNEWYTKDAEMRGFGDEIGVAHAKTFPDKSPEEVLLYVEQRVRKAFPEKFTNPNRNKPGTVSSGTSSTSVSHASEYKLSEDERRIMNSFVRSGTLTKEEYIRDLKKIKGEE